MLNTKIKFGAIGLKTAALKLFDDNLARNYLVRALGEMPGLPAKAAQLMGQRLQSDTHVQISPKPMELSLVKIIIENECPQLASQIDEIFAEAITASLGQVHKATLKDGRTVAIKIQYPNIKENIEDQVRLAFGVAQWGPASKYQLDIETFSNFLRTKLLEELDYVKEGEVQNHFATLWSGTMAIRVPKAFPELSSMRVLTQEYLPSIPILEFKTREKTLKQQAILNLNKFVLTSLLKHQQIHSDLQFGNFGFSESGELIVYDFGSTLQIDDKAIKGIKKALILGLGAKDHFYEILVELGFDSIKLKYLADRLPQLCEVFLTPVSTQEWDPAKWDLSGRISNTLGDQKWWFRTSGPPWVLYLMRTFSGWFNAVSTLNQTISFPSLLPKYFDATDISSILNPTTKGPILTKCLSQTLNVSVRDGIEEVAYVQLPARSIENIEDLISDQAIVQIKEAGVDLESIKNNALKSDLAPQILFEAHNGTRVYKVWLS